MKRLLIIIASQDYENANHKRLWEELATYTDVLVVNIPADYITSVITRKAYRITDAKRGIVKADNQLSLYRPLLFLRPEVIPDSLYPIIAKQFWGPIDAYYSDISSREINILVYDGRWIKILKNTKPNLLFAYYLFDEVRKNGHDGSIDKSRTIIDDYACKNASLILTMTTLLSNSRSEYTTKKIVIGNGADIVQSKKSDRIYIKNSVAFIGNIRDWIDQDLVRELIESNPKVYFCFVGPVERNMQNFLADILDNYTNTAYLGKSSKDRMPGIYQMFDVVIIPYKQNDFIKATRPIKIVESVLAGTPVVTVPINGYKENVFIRFATDKESFESQINYLLSHRVIEENEELFQSFVRNNTWRKKAELITRELEECRKENQKPL